MQPSIREHSLHPFLLGSILPKSVCQILIIEASTPKLDVPVNDPQNKLAVDAPLCKNLLVNPQYKKRSVERKLILILSYPLDFVSKSQTIYT
jgi:hypothetical protein